MLEPRSMLVVKSLVSLDNNHHVEAAELREMC
jgi:hypothetical protein